MSARKMSWSIKFLGSLTLYLLLLCEAETSVKYYDFVLQETNFTRLCASKSMVTVNGSLPGPVMYVNRGDTVFVNVHNQGYYGITMHWHGVKNPRNPWSDGPEYITQCPIGPGRNFTYEIVFSDEEGTLWWHAHSDWARASMHGAIVILPAQGATYPFPKPDGEQVIIIGSWFKGDLVTIIAEAETGYGETPMADAFTINGQPGDFQPCSKGSTYHMKVDYGKTYLLRIVNAAMNRDFFFKIARHNVTVVGWDGAYLKPKNTDYIVITPGQSMDALLTANQEPGEYYMIGAPFYDGDLVDFSHNVTAAILQYSGDYPPPPDPILPEHIPHDNDTSAVRHFVDSLRSLASEEHPVDVPQEVTTRILMTLSVNLNPCVNNSCAGPKGHRLLASLSNFSFVNPSIDVLQAYYRNLSGIYEADFPNKPYKLFNFTSDDLDDESIIHTNQTTKVKVLNYNESVEIIFQGTNIFDGSQNHPMHLHGFRFYLVGAGVGNFDNKTDPLTLNLADPPEVNTVLVPKNGWAVIRFRADNPGVWLLHCHLDQHLTWGMDTAFIVKNGKTPAESVRPPPTYMPPCDIEPLLHHVVNITGGKMPRMI